VRPKVLFERRDPTLRSNRTKEYKYASTSDSVNFLSLHQSQVIRGERIGKNKRPMKDSLFVGGSAGQV
jgi:hypothetical protein